MTFDNRESVLQVEEGNSLAPKFDENGLIPCICQSMPPLGRYLMFAYMNAEALEATLSTGLAHYWSTVATKALEERGNLWNDSTGQTGSHRR